MKKQGGWMLTEKGVQLMEQRTGGSVEFTLDQFVGLLPESHIAMAEYDKLKAEAAVGRALATRLAEGHVLGLSEHVKAGTLKL